MECSKCGTFLTPGLRQILAVVSTGMIMTGMMSVWGYPSAVLPQLSAPDSPINFTSDQASWFATVTLMMCIPGSFTGGVLSEHVGPRKTILLLSPLLALAMSIMALGSCQFLQDGAAEIMLLASRVVQNASKHLSRMEISTPPMPLLAYVALTSQLMSSGVLMVNWGWREEKPLPSHLLPSPLTHAYKSEPSEARSAENPSTLNGKKSPEITMLLLLITSFLMGLALATNQYEMCYSSRESEDNSCMQVQVDANAQTVHYHMPESGDFEDVETLEDFQVGLAASRVESQEACYVRRLVKTLEEQIEYIESNQHNDQTVDSSMQVSAVPLDSPEEEIGEDLAHFCGDLPVYKMVAKEEVGEEAGEPDRRQVSVTFRRCVLLCFIPICYSTTLTLPTGSTITFGWVFFG